jgi:nicotinate-nucleotide adenylyltransferase
MHIALFGGSFDPPHIGHVLCATWAVAMGGADRVWVLPTARHPYAKPLTAWERRWAMCQAAFAGLGFAELRADELHNPSGYTIDLVERLMQTHPEHRWSLVGGSDTAADLRNWHRGDELERLVSVIAVPRRGVAAGEPALPAVSSSEIRAILAGGGNASDRLPQAVAACIARGGWYRA